MFKSLIALFFASTTALISAAPAEKPWYFPGALPMGKSVHRDDWEWFKVAIGVDLCDGMYSKHAVILYTLTNDIGGHSYECFDLVRGAVHGSDVIPPSFSGDNRSYNKECAYLRDIQSNVRFFKEWKDLIPEVHDYFKEFEKDLQEKTRHAC